MTTQELDGVYEWPAVARLLDERGLYLAEPYRLTLHERGGVIYAGVPSWVVALARRLQGCTGHFSPDEGPVAPNGVMRAKFRGYETDIRKQSRFAKAALVLAWCAEHAPPEERAAPILAVLDMRPTGGLNTVCAMLPPERVHAVVQEAERFRRAAAEARRPMHAMWEKTYRAEVDAVAADAWGPEADGECYRRAWLAGDAVGRREAHAAGVIAARGWLLEGEEP